jgi:hypothetical protein
MSAIRDSGESGEGGDGVLADDDAPFPTEFSSVMRATLAAVEILAALARAASVAQARSARRTD